MFSFGLTVVICDEFYIVYNESLEETLKISFPLLKVKTYILSTQNNYLDLSL